jgi:hypothetical protein
LDGLLPVRLHELSGLICYGSGPGLWEDRDERGSAGMVAGGFGARVGAV